MTLNKRLDKLEEIVSKHLEESGEIRTDLKWLKKAVYWMVGGGVFMSLVSHIWR
jgi:hypothetical protein